MGQHRPPTTTFQDIQDAAEDVVQVMRAGFRDSPKALQRRTDSRKLLPADVARIRFSLLHRLISKILSLAVKKIMSRFLTIQLVDLSIVGLT